MQEPPALLTQHNWQGIERRSTVRTNIDKSALMYVGGQVVAQSCLVRDFNASGIGIRLNGLAILPATFDLSFDGFRSIWKCHLVWREKDIVGARWVRAQA
jgi:hypothetical protein